MLWYYWRRKTKYSWRRGFFTRNGPSLSSGQILYEISSETKFGHFEIALSNIRKLESQIGKVNYQSTNFTLKVFCEEKDLVDKIRVCDAGYSLEGDSCVKRTSVAAKANTSCPNGYSMISGQCISNNTVAKIEKFTCDSIPSIMPDDRGGRHSTFGTVIQGNDCYARLCIVTTAGVSPLPSDESLCDSIALIKSSKTSTYSCAEYTDGEGNCRSVANKTTYYTCASGTLSGSSCVTTETKAFNEVCPEGTTYDLECGKCERGAAKWWSVLNAILKILLKHLIAKNVSTSLLKKNKIKHMEKLYMVN